MSKVIRLSNTTTDLLKEIKEIYAKDPAMKLLSDDQIISAALGMWRMQYMKIENGEITL